MTSAEIQAHLDLAAAHQRAGRWPEAVAAYHAILAADPEDPDALHYLGVAALLHGNASAAVELMNRATVRQADNAELLSNLGEACRVAGRTDDARRCLERAVQLDPRRAASWNNLGAVFRERGDPAAAVDCLARALALDPQAQGTRFNLASAKCDLGDFAAAITLYREILARAPAAMDAWLQLGVALHATKDVDAAMDAVREALRLKPDSAEAAYYLGLFEFGLGATASAVEHIRIAVRADPANPRPHSSLVMALNYLPGATPEDILREHREWDQRHAAPLRPTHPVYAQTRDPERPLRIGFVSPDLRNHALACNLLPMFRERDRRQFQFYCYANVRRPDDWTEKFRGLVDGWRDILPLSDEAAAAQIRADEIDVLVDLALHSPDHRLLVFARRPAPVQATFAGYPGTTGLSAIDYRLTDPWLDPPGETDHQYAEQSWRLPASFWYYEPFVADVPVNALPAATNRFITFGCLNEFGKINDTVLVRWAAVLRAVPDSRLVLLTQPGRHRQAVQELLASNGVVSERVTFVPRAIRDVYFRYYHEIDIGLDTLPYNGHTSSLDCYWMGVPVVTQVGATAVGRAGWSQLSNLGLTELAARDDAGFVRIAVELARDLPRLAELRAGLRARMQKSALCDRSGFTRGVESAWRAMWRHYCRTAGG